MIRYPNDLVPDRKAMVFAVVVTAGTALASGYFVVAGLVNPGWLVPGGDTQAARTYASYVAARGLVLLGAALWFAAVRSWRRLGLVLVLNGAVQVLDAVVGVAGGEAVKAIGPACFAVALFLASAWLERGSRASG
jgi:hypothetical protein